YPARIESLFKMEPVVSQVVLIGDKKPYVTAILTINPVNAKSVKGVDGASARELADLVKAEPVAKAVKDVVTRVNSQLADFERIRRFRVLDREFAIERGELTPTMKIRSALVLGNSRVLVSELYISHVEKW